jgi:glycyl-tRNA synthetase beta chain
MGAYYARHDGERPEVAQAIAEQYMPRFSGDAIPLSLVGTVVAMADKLETIAGLFSVGQTPTGDKDPFALRRHAVGILRMCIEKPIAVSLRAIVGAAMQEKSLNEHSRKRGNDAPFAILAFFYDRLAVMMRDAGYSAQEVEAVVSVRPEVVAEVPKRLEAVRAFAALPESVSLAAANKRISNILKKSDAAQTTAVNESLLIESAEKALASALHSAGPLADKLFDNGEYAASLRELAVLKAPVDAFFESVMVNADDPALRANRLALLQSLHTAMNRVADLSKLAT